MQMVWSIREKSTYKNQHGFTEMFLRCSKVSFPLIIKPAQIIFKICGGHK